MPANSTPAPRFYWPRQPEPPPLPRLSALDLARRSNQFFSSLGYPFMAVELWPDGTFPVVTFWDDHAQVIHYIAYTDDPAQLPAALDYALTCASECQYGTLAHAADVCSYDCFSASLVGCGSLSHFASASIAAL